MQNDKIIAAIAAYLDAKTEFRVDFVEGKKTEQVFFRNANCSDFLQNTAAEISAAIAPLVEAGVNKNIEEAKAIVVKVAASLVRSQACEYAEDLNLPKTTPITAMRKFEHEARVWNDTNRLRAIELKRAYDLMK